MAAKERQALRFTQWLKDWDTLQFSENEFRRKPSPSIYLLSMPAAELRALSGVFRRSREDGVASGIQRGHDKDRSVRIREFVQNGYPYSEMSAARRKSFDSEDLRKPGWLPTAIVVNVLTEGDTRRGRKVANEDLVRISDTDGSISQIELPSSFSGGTWAPSELAPIEVIDGQHRLYAFDGAELPGDFELPVVAFHGLDIGWQAYLFWSINVSPKKINPSHAFDLYPLLRSQDWLEKFQESNVYREARAQELTEFLYSHPDSPWHKRINMLGERGVGGATQAGWIRALSSTFLASGRGKGAKGLFGCALSDTVGPLPWTRPQQAAFLIKLWQLCEQAVAHSNDTWTEQLRLHGKVQSNLIPEDVPDPAFRGPQTMLNQEQGIRGLLSVSNEILFDQAESLGLQDWETDDSRGSTTSIDEITHALDSLANQPFRGFMESLASALATYDWRSADASGLTYDEKLKRRAFRGSGGYAALRSDLLMWLSKRDDDIGQMASGLLRAGG
ncbi:DGQHR domain-containing protein [Lysobacter sp. GCM10012299]|uniref:DGQHR domain-containing protein n=1 Tax=Lysobacter sp. GCM10012299 TaxID=3317333 RepID=UPI003618E8B4